MLTVQVPLIRGVIIHVEVQVHQRALGHAVIEGLREPRQVVVVVVVCRNKWLDGTWGTGISRHDVTKQERRVRKRERE